MQDLTNKILDILQDEVVPAEGCTEPISIALACAKAASVLGKKPEKIKLILSTNVIKNVHSVTVPNSGNRRGIAVSAAMGAFAGDSEQDLMVISDVTPEQLNEVIAFLDKKSVHIENHKQDVKLYVKAKLSAGNDSASVEIKHKHNNITEIIHNDNVILKLEEKEAVKEDKIKHLSVKEIYSIVNCIELSLVSDLLDKIIICNSAISTEGLTNNYGVSIGKNIQQSIDSGFYGADLRNVSASVTASGSDARMAGCALPVMTIAGSGNVGLTCSMPIIEFCRQKNKSQDVLYRGLLFSILTTIYIKAQIGRLSAFCGPICASAAVSGALAYLNGFEFVAIESSIINTLGGVSGIFCDGANSSCAVKVSNGVYAAYDGVAMAANNRVITSGDGIVGNSLEETIANLGEIAIDGMKQTDEVMLKIMTQHD